MRKNKRRRRSKRRVITVKETSEKLDLSLNATYQAIRAGQIPAIRIGRRWLVPDHALEQMLANANQDDQTS